jgi:hypothetical protein
MKCKVFGDQKDTVVVEMASRHPFEIKAADAIVKLWFSDGTILGIKYGKYSKLYHNIWNIRILNKGSKNYNYTQCFKETLLNYSDVYETEAELLNYRIIPRTYYVGDDLT